MDSVLCLFSLPVSPLEGTFPGAGFWGSCGAVSGTLCAGPSEVGPRSHAPGARPVLQRGTAAMSQRGPGQPSARRGLRGRGLACGAGVQQPSVHCWTRWVRVERMRPLGKGACGAPQPQGKPPGAAGAKRLPRRVQAPEPPPPGPGATPGSGTASLGKPLLPLPSQGPF